MGVRGRTGLKILLLTVLMGNFWVWGFAAEAVKEAQEVSQKPTPTMTPTMTKDYLDFASETNTPDLMPLSKIGIKMVLSLALVLALVIVTLYVIKHFYSSPSIGIKGQKLKLIKVIERFQVAPRQSIYLFWAVDRVLVVSEANGQMNLLTEIKDQSTIEGKIPGEFTDVLVGAKLKFSEVYS